MKKVFFLFFLLISLSLFSQQQYRPAMIKGYNVYDFVLPVNYEVIDTLLLQSDIHRGTFNSSPRTMLNNKIPKLKKKYPTANGVIIFEKRNSDYIVVIRESYDSVGVSN